jgi:hypothetical protein
MTPTEKAIFKSMTSIINFSAQLVVEILGRFQTAASTNADAVTLENLYKLHDSLCTAMDHADYLGK